LKRKSYDQYRQALKIVANHASARDRLAGAQSDLNLGLGPLVSPIARSLEWCAEKNFTDTDIEYFNNTLCSQPNHMHPMIILLTNNFTAPRRPVSCAD
jgi:hypothetical protein